MWVLRIDEIHVWESGNSRSGNSEDLLLAQLVPTSAFKIIVAVMWS